jgi:hypothetical protein
MIEQGLIALLLSDATVGPMVTGAVRLLRAEQGDETQPHLVVFNTSSDYCNTFDGPTALRMQRIQVSCYAPTAAGMVNLARAVHNLLDGYQGTLSDPNSTYVNGINPNQDVDVFDPDSQLFHRSTDYNVWFIQT